MMSSIINKWAVVQFVRSDIEKDDLEIATVPYSWIISKNGKINCYWPNSKIRKHIQKATTPCFESWNLYEIIILRETENFEEALEYEKKKALTSESEADETIKFGRGSRKRKANKCNEDYISDIDMELDRIISPPPKLKIIDIDDSHNSTSDTLTLSDTESDEEPRDQILMPPPLVIPSKKVDKNVNIVNPKEQTVRCSSIISSDENSNMAVDDKLENKENDIEYRNAEEKNTGLCCMHGAILERILENTVATRTLLNEQNKAFQQSIGSIVEPRRDIVENFETVPSKPFRLYKKLIKYEEIIKNSADAKIQLGTIFYMCGGQNEKEAIRRGLSRIFSDQLARKCSWTGRKNNFPLRDLATLTLLKDAVRKRFNSLSDKLFETEVASWFRQAQLRYIRHKPE